MTVAETTKERSSAAEVVAASKPMKQTDAVRHTQFRSQLALLKRLAAPVAQPSGLWGRRASCPSIRRLAVASSSGRGLEACATAISAPNRLSTHLKHLITLKSKPPPRALRTTQHRALPSDRGERLE